MTATKPGEPTERLEATPYPVSLNTNDHTPRCHFEYDWLQGFQPVIPDGLFVAVGIEPWGGNVDPDPDHPGGYIATIRLRMPPPQTHAQQDKTHDSQPSNESE